MQPHHKFVIIAFIKIFKFSIKSSYVDMDHKKNQNIVIIYRLLGL